MSQFEPPNGGWLGWSQVTASFLANVCTLGLSNSFGVFQSYYEHNTLNSYSSSHISWIGTTQGFLLSIIGIISGPLYDRGYIRHLMYAGSILNVIGLLGTSYSENYSLIFLSYGVALGLGCGALYVPAQATIQTYFTTRASLANGISMAGSSFGGIIYPIIFRQLEQSIGFPGTCRTLALINAVLLVISCLLIKPRGRADESSKVGSFDWRSLWNRDLWLLGICVLLLNAGVDVPYYYISTFVQERLHQSAGAGDSLLAGMNGSSLVGRLALAYLAKYLKPIKIWQSTILGACILLFCWSSVESLAGMITFVILYGFHVGGLIVLIPSCVRHICPDPDVLGARLGFVEAFQGVGFLIGPPIAGAILETSSGYLGVSLFCGILYFALFLAVGFFTWRKGFKLPL
ncbi:MFS general substrate transporter [Annulohypoxylon truncatum]|uniref:MFS general substrate transporter n=1 Tax=Annulohypoxylon truncatum TaxID=327061 RepID=UPI00200867EF|nr:MFS general substrate transporter [Annulohypoxylon truncatum]KAI1208137.1 MFS general substrate transporter [Annulohypoxylon truncatum]